MKRKIINTICFLGIMSMAIVSCKKDNSELTLNRPDSKEIQKITDWLDIQKRKYGDTSSQKSIELLKNNLLLSKITVVTLNTEENIVVIPISKDFKTINITTQLSFKHLVIIETNDGKIKQGNIIEIIPKQQHFTNSYAQLMADVYNNKDNDLNGVFSFISITNKFITEREYRNGKLYSIRNLAGKNKGVQGQKVTLNTSGCIDWYWQYFVDGVLVHEQYAYTTCGEIDECQVSRLIDGGTPFKLNCGGGANGGNVETSFDVNETEAADDESDGIAPKILYNYHATVTRVNGEVTSVIVDPITVSNLFSVYVDNYGRSTTRTLTLFGHSNNWTSLGTSALINWSCFVNGRWLYTDGSPMYSRTWLQSHSAVR